ncbi:tyrosine-type recombinase/integrase [Saccharopolyspora mangrovi]|uniref:Site-specific integrase n=1 Tax=Saccharopolyspora mangrovi TaxID=3082379 RepID=A0ABU6AF31_9PSEU|nr:site-specific integrase [Saccharopolyspora sp. S2-29]MEB3370146.1 site-specific integrase [Saccharopolyspora sp. S2-29]
MGTVHRLSTAGRVTLDEAVAAFLDEFSRPDQAATRRTYADVLRHLPPSSDGTVGAFDAPDAAERLRMWFRGRWGQAAPATWNRNLAALRSAVAFWRVRGWLTEDPTAALARAPARENRARARGRATIDKLLARDDISLREKTFWALAYESAARAAELLLIDVDDLDLAKRRAVVRRKGGAAEVITWQTRTARLLHRHVSTRTRGPVFCTIRAARVPVADADRDPDTGRARLSYRRAAELFKHASGGWTLHDLRHSALTHAAEDGMPTPMLMTKSGHTSIRSLSRYAQPSVNALARWHAERDPAARKARPH